MRPTPLTFTVPGTPQPKERPRVGKHGNVYTPRKTSCYEATVAAHALAGLARAGWRRRGSVEGRYVVTLRVYWPDARRRDLDNAIKSTTDALNGLAYVDDSQIAELHAYGEIDRERPRVEVTVELRDRPGRAGT